MLGIDYASIAGNDAPDWRAAKKAGTRFALLRGSYVSKYGKVQADPHLLRDWKNIPSTIVKGAYMFPDPRSHMSPKDQVDVYTEALEKAGGLTDDDLPPVLDIEFPGGIVRGKTPAQKRAVRKRMLDWMLDAADHLKINFGIWPMLYTSARVWDSDHDDALDADTMMEIAGDLKNCPLWLARYPYKYNLPPVLKPPVMEVTTPAMWGSGNYFFHQFQGNVVNMPGFTGLTDLNLFKVMNKGEKGPRVKWVQKKLGVKTDGIFGPGTEKAVCKLQKACGLTVDGVIGVSTFAALCWV